MDNNEINNNKELDNKEIKSKKKIISIVMMVILIVFIVFIIDFTYTWTFKKKPLITINAGNDKYSSVFYDVYICGDEKIIKFKNQKYNCIVEQNIDNIEQNNDSNDQSNQDSKNEFDDSLENEDSNNDSNYTDENNNIEDNDEVNDNEYNITNDKESSITMGNEDIKIVDRSSSNCAQAIDYYYEDSNYKYYFTCIKSNSIYIIKNGQEYTIKYALNNNIVSMDELIEVGFKPLKQSKNLVDK